MGLLNMMPDKALIVTERQFATLLGIDAAGMLKFTLPEIMRGPTISAHIHKYYAVAANIADSDLDVLVISGANVSDPVLANQVFWNSLTEILDWAQLAKVPTLCSCLATHAVLASCHQQERRPTGAKVWGVHAHRLAAPGHQILSGLPLDVAVPHSRHNDISADQFATAGYEVLLWQGGQRADYPVLPANYVSRSAAVCLQEYQDSCRMTGAGKEDYDPFPEDQVWPTLQNTWSETARLTVANWLGTLP